MEKKVTQNGQKPTQLPVKGGSKALALQVNETRNKTADEFDSAADKWLSENPSGKDFNEAEFGRKTLPVQPDPDVEASVDTPPPPDAEEAPPAETPPTDAPPADKPESETQGKTPEAAPSSQPASIQPAAAATPAPAAPTAPTSADPTRLAPEARFYIGDGTVPWTGHQITLALGERAAALPLAEEAKQFRQFFGAADVEQAKSAWSPMLDALRKAPERIKFLEDALEHMPAEKFQYLVDSAEHYDREIGVEPGHAAQATRPAEPQYAKVDPAFEARLTAFEKREAEGEARTQWNYALTTYPVLTQRKELRDQLVELFNNMYSRDPKVTLYDVLKINAPMYDAINVAQPTPARPAEPARELPPVPALNGSSGATPAGTRPPVDDQPQKFEDLEDAVENWMKHKS